MPKGRLYIVCGLPGSGKTSLAKGLERRFDAVRFCPDEWLADLGLDIFDETRRTRIETLQWKMAHSFLRNGIPVIVEWGTWARAERDQLRLRAREIGAAVELHYLTAPIDVLYARIVERGAEKPPIQLDDLQRWAGLFEEPTADELALFDSPQP